jgi:hypothetical protein
MKMLLSFLPLFLLTSRPACSQSPYPGGPLVNSPNAYYENETQQVGGAGWHWYTYVGALRCQGDNEAIVGVFSRRGSVLDYVQIACAPIICGPQGCGWKHAAWGAGAGDAKGRSLANKDVCPANMIVAGFRGGSAGNGAYATDIQVECAKLTGQSRGQTQLGLLGKQKFAVMPKGEVGQGYGRGNFGQMSQLRNASGPRTWPAHAAFSSSDNERLSSCSSGGATALSVAVARWNVAYQVVQAYSMFCANGFGSPVVEDRINQRN